MKPLRSKKRPRRRLVGASSRAAIRRGFVIGVLAAVVASCALLAVLLLRLPPMDRAYYETDPLHPVPTQTPLPTPHRDSFVAGREGHAAVPSRRAAAPRATVAPVASSPVGPPTRAAARPSQAVSRPKPPAPVSRPSRPAPAPVSTPLPPIVPEVADSPRTPRCIVNLLGILVCL